MRPLRQDILHGLELDDLPLGSNAESCRRCHSENLPLTRDVSRVHFVLASSWEIEEVGDGLRAEGLHRHGVALGVVKGIDWDGPLWDLN